MAGVMLFAACGKDEDNNNGADTGSTTEQQDPENGGETPTPTPDPLPEGFVDLGLPSGLLWAECNLGATSPEGYGYYYAWGEVTTKDIYSWANYKYCDGSNNSLTKYCDNSNVGYNGFTDNKTTLEAMDDAATQLLGSDVRIPTKAEWEELLNNTTNTRTTQNGVNGFQFTAENGQSLFLPAAGIRGEYSEDVLGADEYGEYWSSSLHEGYPGGAWDLLFSSDNPSMGHYTRERGHSIRAVRSAH